MAKVVLKPDETVDSLLKRFKKQVKKEDILYECKKRKYFVPTALKAKEKSLHAKLKANPKHR